MPRFSSKFEHPSPGKTVSSAPARGGWEGGSRLASECICMRPRIVHVARHNMYLCASQVSHTSCATMSSSGQPAAVPYTSRWGGGGRVETACHAMALLP